MKAAAQRRQGFLAMPDTFKFSMTIVSNRRNAPPRPALDEQMHVARHHLDRAAIVTRQAGKARGLPVRS
jgi:hypothetical protein